jgi:adenine-specific DNA methylase
MSKYLYWKSIEQDFARIFGSKRNWAEQFEEGGVDIICDDVLVSVKSTKNQKQIILKKESLDEIRNVAKSKGKIGLLGFKLFGDDSHYVIFAIEDINGGKK